MGWAVNVDVGGTFTDAFVHSEDRYATGKARTTPHDLSLGFDAAVSDAFEKLGHSLDEGLGATDWVKYATTVGTNALVQRVYREALHCALADPWLGLGPLLFGSYPFER